MDKKIISIFLCMFFVIAIAPVVNQQTDNQPLTIQKSNDLPIVEAAAKKTKKKYVGSIKSNVYHKLKCRYVKKIKKYNKIYFKTKKQAKKWGYRACKVCHP